MNMFMFVGMASESTQDSLERQNQFLADNLASKVNRLKNVIFFVYIHNNKSLILGKFFKGFIHQ